MVFIIIKDSYPQCTASVVLPDYPDGLRPTGRPAARVSEQGEYSGTTLETSRRKGGYVEISAYDVR
jgi:hypothetical protein